MAARPTRSASRKARATEAVATGPLGALSHDELGVIVDGLADPLQPVVAVALSSTCLGLRTPLQAAIEVLKERHARAVALCRKFGTSCAALRDAEELEYNEGITAEDMATLGVLLSKWLPSLRQLCLIGNGFGDARVQALCEGLGPGTAPLPRLGLGDNNIGPAGAEALAAAFRRGALSKLEWLDLTDNPIGSQGMAALATPLRNMPTLESLFLCNCEIGDEGVASLVANLGKDDFKKLEDLDIEHNGITDAGMAKLLSAVNSGGVPNLSNLEAGHGNDASPEAVYAVHGAIQRRRRRAAHELLLEAEPEICLR